ncbi:hypothetical protein J6590_035431 [Homalodisca vitripennis]|nr:hypothetical protein J6590_035431 [Homalodisca vitripennis]
MPITAHPKPGDKANTPVLWISSNLQYTGVIVALVDFLFGIDSQDHTNNDNDFKTVSLLSGVFGSSLPTMVGHSPWDTTRGHLRRLKSETKLRAAA